jgi:dienelactone hydrolase
MVARYLQHKNMGTFLFDLLSIEEDAVYENRFDIPKLTRRLIAATEWLQELPAMKNLRMGYFGASTGAASALRAAAQLPQIAAVVSRGGRPDLAMDVLPFVKAPTLLIVGGLDSYVLELNREAYEQLGGIKKVEVVQGATHLFEEAGKMDAVCALAADWFEVFLVEGKEHVF